MWSGWLTDFCFKGVNSCVGNGATIFISNKSDFKKLRAVKNLFTLVFWSTLDSLIWAELYQKSLRYTLTCRHYHLKHPLSLFSQFFVIIDPNTRDKKRKQRDSWRQLSLLWLTDIGSWKFISILKFSKSRKKIAVIPIRNIVSVCINLKVCPRLLFYGIFVWMHHLLP